MKKLCIILLVNCFVFSAIAIQAQNDTVSLENKLKSAFIYNFTKYIKWADDDSTETFKIAVIGDSEIISPLKEIEETELVNNRKIEIKHYQNVSDINDCHILFISASEKNLLQEILKTSENKNILTVSDNIGFAREGVAINFVLVDGKLKFEINSNAINNAKLQVSSHLLKLAILIENGKIR
ncbi:YfiR/HmsC family protein [Candidatus Latescibacterota bacterium]